MAQYFKLPYWCKDCGDGSVSVRFSASIHDAEDEEEKNLEENGISWGETSAGTIVLKVEDGKLFFKDFVYDESLKKFNDVWIEVNNQ